ncbi:MAG TPA: ABC transporter ATP-binding protein [Acidimicrobiia bacterium]
MTATIPGATPNGSTGGSGNGASRNGDPARKSAFGVDVTSPFVPIGVTPEYPPPKNNIDPDRRKSWLRRALPIVLAHKGIFISSLVIAFIGLVFQVLIPAELAQAIDALKPGGDSLTKYVVVLVVLALLRFVTNYSSRLLLLRTAYRIEYDLRNILYEHFTRMSFSFYDRVQSGQLISRANSDIRAVQMYLSQAPFILVQCSVVVLAFVLMLSINVPLAFVAMSTMPFVFVAGVKMRKRMFPVSWLIQARLADVATVVDENIQGVRVVKSFAAEPEQLRLLDSTAKRAEWANVEQAEIRARYAPLIENLPRLGQALVLLYGGYLAINGQASVGDIAAFNAYVLMLVPPFRQLGFVMMMGQRAAASAQRIYEVLDEQPDIVDRPGAVDLVECKGDVEFADVDFVYGNGTSVLRDFDLHLRPGETVALVGRTGTGKSTVARLLARFYDVSDGAVRIDGRDVRDITLASLRHHIGMVLDDPFLFSVSIRDNIAYGRPDAPIEEVEAAARAAGADEFIRALPEGYDTVVGERGFTLSGGQRQRISIARTLLVNPPILVLDDATSAIDVQIEQQIHAALSQLMKSRTTLIIAHRLSTISLADRVAVVEDGRVIAEGTHTELLATEPRYVEILAQAEKEDDEARAARAARAAEGNGHVAGDDHDALQHEIEVDVEETKLLDEEVGVD